MTNMSAPSGNPTNQKVKLTIKRLPNSRDVDIKCSHVLPSSRDVMQHMDRKTAHHIRNMGHYWDGIGLHGLITACGSNVRLKHWSEAIIRAIEAAMGDEHLTTELMVKTRPAYMVAGNALLKLECVEWIGTGPKALPALRKRIMTDAELEKEHILDLANEAAIGLRRTVTREANEVRRSVDGLRAEAMRLRDEIAQMWTPPQWMRNLDVPIIFLQTIYKIMVSFDCVITRFVAHRSPDILSVWHGLNRPAFTVPCWVSVTYDNTLCQHGSVHLDSRFRGTLPHMDGGRSCMTMSSAPKSLSSPEDYEQLKIALASAMCEVNLNSLLTGYSSWSAHVKRFIPRTVKDSLNATPMVSWSTLTADATESTTPADFSTQPPIVEATNQTPNPIAVDAEITEIEGDIDEP